MTEKKIDYYALASDVFKLMLQFENKNITGKKKKAEVLTIIKNHYNLSEDQIDLINNFIDIIILFYKVNKNHNNKCFKCF